MSGLIWLDKARVMARNFHGHWVRQIKMQDCSYKHTLGYNHELSNVKV